MVVQFGLPIWFTKNTNIFDKCNFSHIGGWNRFNCLIQVRLFKWIIINSAQWPSSRWLNEIFELMCFFILPGFKNNYLYLFLSVWRCAIFWKTTTFFHFCLLCYIQNCSLILMVILSLMIYLLFYQLFMIVMCLFACCGPHILT